MTVPSHAHCMCGSEQVVLREVGEGDTAHCWMLLSNQIFELE